MKNLANQSQILSLFQLLRWNKPSGRLILLIPAGWSLWLTPNAPPSIFLVLLILCGGIFISAAGCIANDLWDRRFDSQILRTKKRPLANGSIKVSTALMLLSIMLTLSFLVVLMLPIETRKLCLILAFSALPVILLYPSAKRWFALPQAILAISWGFSVLIPWAASQNSLTESASLYFCWAATIIWTFGFDTVYAMADKEEDIKLFLKSSAISLGSSAITVVSLSYGFTCVLLALAAITANVNFIFWPFLLIAGIGMQKEVHLLRKEKKEISISTSGNHFKNQVYLGGLILLGLMVSRLN